jgi:hypothetical protein
MPLLTTGAGGYAAAGGGGPFTPASIAGIWGWYKADAGVFADTAGTVPITNGTGVALWKEQSLGGGPNLPQATLGNRPVWNNTGLGVLNFTAASSQCLITPSGSAAIGTPSQITMFVAFNMDMVNTPAYGRVLAYAAPGANDYNPGSFVFSRNSSNNGVEFDGPVSSGFLTVSPTPPYPASGTVFIAVVMDGTNGKIYLAVPSSGSFSLQATAAQTTANLVNNGTLGVGSQINTSGVASGSGMQGQQYEIVIVKGDATASLANMYAYFNGRWP